MPEPLWAYLVHQLTVDSGILQLDPSYVPQPTEGSIILSKDTGENAGTPLYGRREHTAEFEDGPVKTYADMVYLGEGVAEDDGKITFGLGMKRLLNLISLGVENEQVLRVQIHEFAERVQTKLEPIAEAAARGKSGPDHIGDILRAVDEVEKHFWDRKH